MTECICKGNLQLIVSECEKYFDKKFINNMWPNESGTFIGITISSDDYYYSFINKYKELKSYSCVGNLEGWGFELEEPL